MSAIDVLRAYGEAIRGSWADIDGRSERRVLHRIADEIENPTMTDAELASASGVCLPCGSWLEFCRCEGGRHA